MGEAVLRQAGDVAALEDDAARRSAAKAPDMKLKKVLLPAPFGPMIEVSLSGEEVDADVLQSAVKPPKLLGDALGVEGSARRSSARSQCSSEPQMPRGKNSTSSTNIVPTTICQCVVTTVDHVLQQEEEAGADERAEEGAHAAEQRHHQHVGRS